MTSDELKIRVLEEFADGHCYRGVWRWTLADGEPCTRQVNWLKKKGYVSGQYFTGGRASVNPTDAGLEYLKELKGKV